MAHEFAKPFGQVSLLVRIHNPVSNVKTQVATNSLGGVPLADRPSPIDDIISVTVHLISIGLVLEPGKRFAQTVSKSFHVSMACLEINNNDNDFVPVFIDVDGREYIVCNLHRHKMIQVQLDLTFALGDKIAFYTTGKSKIHLTGYLFQDDDDDDGDDDDEFETQDSTDFSLEHLEKLANSGKRKKPTPAPKKDLKKQRTQTEPEDSVTPASSSGPSKIKEKGKNKSLISPQKQSPVNKKLEVTRTPNKKSEVTHTPNKKLKNKSPEGKDLGQTPAQLINGTPDSSKKKKKKNKLDTTPSGAKTPKTPGTPAKTLEGGVVVEELKVGTGQTAKQGNLISVYYTGRLKQNNKQFDSVTKGPGFKFKLGRNEVIRGWDIALAGMKVGGKRKVVIPPPLAYGTKGSPPVIPPNSALVFEVELLSLN
uniref:peptidylprolyl isomerase n=1 Tax=Timema douglasi TaxID=61478 RepID=A0A7R8VRB4_TIMDO|nr:unnamed protein product [Timema douglasi]